MQDVAERAGVSVPTVSRVINASGNVTPEKRERVRLAMVDLGYVPDRAGRSLARGKTDSVGLLLILPPRIASNDVYFLTMLRGIEAALGGAGLSTVLTVQSADDPDQGRIARVLAGSRLDGLAIMGDSVNRRHLQAIRRAGLPLVIFGSGKTEPRTWYAGNDSRQASQEAVRHLVTGGRQRIAFVGGSPDHHATVNKLDGYRQALAVAGLEADPQLQVNGGLIHSREGGSEAVETLLARGASFDAMYAADDLLGLGALLALAAHGRRVPDDVAVVGYGDLEESRFADPPLTSIHVDFHELGWLGGTILARAIAEPDLPSYGLTVESRLIVRKSSGAGAAPHG